MMKKAIIILMMTVLLIFMVAPFANALPPSVDNVTLDDHGWGDGMDGWHSNWWFFNLIMQYVVDHPL